MIEKVTDLWTEPADARCITTNGTITKTGALVMGGGVALAAKERHPQLPRIWGTLVQLHGNHVRLVVIGSELLFAFPTKEDVKEPSTIERVEKSAHELMAYMDKYPLFNKVLLPYPGCGLGGLRWRDVKPVLVPILDDRVWIINNEYTYDFDPPEGGRKVRC